MESVFCVYLLLERYYDDHNLQLERLFNNYKSAEAYVNGQPDPEYYLIEEVSVYK